MTAPPQNSSKVKIKKSPPYERVKSEDERRLPTSLWHPSHLLLPLPLHRVKKLKTSTFPRTCPPSPPSHLTNDAQGMSPPQRVPPTARRLRRQRLREHSGRREQGGAERLGPRRRRGGRRLWRKCVWRGMIFVRFAVSAVLAMGVCVIRWVGRAVGIVFGEIVPVRLLIESDLVITLSDFPVVRLMTWKMRVGRSGL